MTIKNAMEFYDNYPDRDKCKMAEAILRTHLPMH